MVCLMFSLDTRTTVYPKKRKNESAVGIIIRTIIIRIRIIITAIIIIIIMYKSTMLLLLLLLLLKVQRGLYGRWTEQKENSGEGQVEEEFHTWLTDRHRHSSIQLSRTWGKLRSTLIPCLIKRSQGQGKGEGNRWMEIKKNENIELEIIETKWLRRYKWREKVG